MGEETLEAKRHRISGKSVMLTRRVEAPANFIHTISVSDTIRLPAQVTLNCSWNKLAQKYEIAKFELEPFPNGEPITSHLLRQVPVGAVLESALRTHLILHAKVRTPSGVMSIPDAVEYIADHRKGLMSLGPRSAKALQWVAAMHELAGIESTKPTQAVSDLFGISLRTASNWVKAARDTGTLDDG